MKSSDEMIRAVHAKAGILRRRQSIMRTVLAGGACVVLSAALLAAIGSFGGLWHRPVAAGFVGASLLGDSVGGYVLVAITAFMLGVMITVYFKWKQRKESTRTEDPDARLDPDGDSGFVHDDALAAVAGGKKTSEDEEEDSDTEGGTA